MRIIKTMNGKAEIQLSTSEINILINALNEVCRSISKAEFKTRMGVSCERCIKLSDFLLQVLNNAEIE